MSYRREKKFYGPCFRSLKFGPLWPCFLTSPFSCLEPLWHGSWLLLFPTLGNVLIFCHPSFHLYLFKSYFLKIHFRSSPFQYFIRHVCIVEITGMCANENEIHLQSHDSEKQPLFKCISLLCILLRGCNATMHGLIACLFFFFNWNTVDLQCSVSFRYTAKWFIYLYCFLKLIYFYLLFGCVGSLLLHAGFL